MLISEVAEQSGLSVATIRYYEASGICPPIARGPNGHRRFTPENLDWLTLLAALRDTAMSNAQMAAFAALYRAGDGTVAARKRMLHDHDARLVAQQARLDSCRARLSHKLARYDAILEEHQ